MRRSNRDPSDFIVDGKCAVEVTRPGQSIIVGSDNHSKGEEQARRPLTDRIEKIIEQLGATREIEEGVGISIAGTTSPCGYQIAGQWPLKYRMLATLLKPCDDSVVAGMHARHTDFSKHAGEILGIPFLPLCLECGICLDLQEFSHSRQSSSCQMYRMEKGFP